MLWNTKSVAVGNTFVGGTLTIEFPRLFLSFSLGWVFMRVMFLKEPMSQQMSLMGDQIQ